MQHFCEGQWADFWCPLNKPTRPQDIIIKFLNGGTKNEVYRSRLNMPMDENPSYINEDITTKRSKGAIIFYWEGGHLIVGGTKIFWGRLSGGLGFFHLFCQPIKLS